MPHYLIPKDQHKSKGQRCLLSRPMSFVFKIKESFRHPDSAVSISKVFGYADGLHHHQNSFRIGVMYNEANDNVAIYAYYYNNGRRFFHEIGQSDFDELNSVELTFKKNMYVVDLNGRTIYFTRTGKVRTYPLFPYYGGRLAAPRDITIFLETF
jgi:hypothetical protein